MTTIDITPPEKKGKDWEKIEAEYRAGQVSNREIAKQYDVAESAIRKKAKAEGWTKDLTAKVQEKVRSDLVRSEVRTSNASDKEIIEAAAARGVEVVRQHRNDISNHRGMASLLLAELQQTTRSREEIEDDIIEETSEDQNEKRRARMLAAVSLPARAAVLRDLSTSLTKIVQLERQAFNLGDDDGDKKKKETPTINVIHQTIVQQSQVN